MSEATYVAFVPRAKREKLRHVLRTEDTGSLRWREERGRHRSAFYFTGPPQLARQTHSYVMNWVAEG